MRKRNAAGNYVLAAAMAAVMTTAVFPALVSADSLKGKEPSESYEAESELYEEEELPGVYSDSTKERVDLSDASVAVEDTSFYICDLESELVYPVYFINDVYDLPFVNLSDWVDLMFQLYGDDTGTYDLKLETDGNVALVTRENGYSMLIDFEAQTIAFDDYDMFVQMGEKASLLDTVSDQYTDEDGSTILIEKIARGSFDRYGKELELDLSAYQIPLYWSEKEGLYLIPLQTLSDFLISNVCGKSIVYNTKAMYLGDSSDFGVDAEELTPIGEACYFVQNDGMSDELAWYSYCELCLALDNLYGLKEIHDISSFDSIFYEVGYKEDLMSADPNVKDGALYDFINYYLDDLHSGFAAPSYLTEEVLTDGEESLSSAKDSEVGGIYFAARDDADHVIESYEEVGNTAYITFDHFTMMNDAEDYYTGEVDVEADPASYTLDTPALIMYAHEQITRKDSPIENVVIDLSLNGGGAVDAAAVVAAWYLGEASISIRSSMTGATSTGTYRSDVNLDGMFDREDTVRDRNLFCIIGPYSFSCGNLVPNMFKSSGFVTLLGKESGGGSCAILPISTAYGTLFNISSPYRMSFLKNGSFYDTDTGIEPDCVIVRPENFYDRETLTEYINQLF